MSRPKIRRASPRFRRRWLARLGMLVDAIEQDYAELLELQAELRQQGFNVSLPPLRTILREFKAGQTPRVVVKRVH